MPPKDKYTEKDAARDTNSSRREVRGAWHNAREDAQRSNNDYDRNMTRDWDRGEKGYAENK